MTSKRVFLETFGCQMNELDSELVHNQLQALGYEFVNAAEDANVLLYNTCSVRDLSEQKVLSRLGKTRERKANGERIVVGVLGCMAERASTDLFRKNTSVDLIVGPSKLDQVGGLLEQAFTTSQVFPTHHQKLVALNNFRSRKGKSSDLNMMDSLESLDSARMLSTPVTGSQAYVRITRGCNKFCSFCVVPRTRGPEVHRSPGSIVEEIKRLVDQGVLEVTLLGQTINHYTYSDGGKTTSFADLLYRVHEEVTDLKRLRFLTSYPRDFTDEALDVMASSDRICKYLHIPAQSGSDAVLRRMNRGYTREIYMSLIERARARMPDISLFGDMIVGFCGETDDDFEASLSLLQEVRYKNVFVFKYSPRPDTVALKREIDDIPVSVKQARNQRMLALQHDISLQHHANMLGQVLPVLVEGSAKINPSENSDRNMIRLSARTTGDHIVAFDGPASLIGKIVFVKLTKASSLAFVGELEAL